MFQVGTKVVFDSDKAGAGQVIRLYGEIVNVGPHRLTIRTSDDQLHVREPQYVALYRVLPPNWKTLFAGVCTVHKRSEVIASPTPKYLKKRNREVAELAPA